MLYFGMKNNISNFVELVVANPYPSSINFRFDFWILLGDEPFQWHRGIKEG
jgi:hypothetical protein